MPPISSVLPEALEVRVAQIVVLTELSLFVRKEREEVGHRVG